MNQEKTIQNILSQREDFLVIGLTGRLGSGCSKVAEVLATPYEEMKFPHPVPQKGQSGITEEMRILRILAEYAQWHWIKFDVIHVGAVISTFILADDSRFIYDLGSGGSVEKQEGLRKAFRETVLKDFYEDLVNTGKRCKLLREEKLDYYIRECVEEEAGEQFIQIRENLLFRKLLTAAYTENLREELKKLGVKFSVLVQDDSIRTYFDETNPNSFIMALTGEVNWEQIKANMNDLLRYGLGRNPDVHRRKYLEYADDLLTLFACHCMMKMLEDILRGRDDYADAFWNKLSKINSEVGPNKSECMEVLQIHKFVFVKYITAWFGKTVRKYVTDELSDDAYARLFQRYGQMIRYHSCILPYAEEGREQQNSCEKRDIFAIPRKINQHIKILRHPFDTNEHRPVRIVVDSIKNVFEAVYLRYRYSAFYLWAITTDSSIRGERLRDKHLTDVQVRKLEWNEYPDKGSDLIRKVDAVLPKTEEEMKKLSWMDIYNTVVDKVGKAEADFYMDCIVRKAENEPYYSEIAKFNKTRQAFFRDGTYVFYTQDVDGCVCNADVYLFNNAKGITDTENNVKLLQAVVRNVSLVMYPGLVRPTPIERCMQIALSAKVNSGCLSRQVGAVVTDAEYNILAIGWNDVPCGEVPCAYKNLKDVSAYADQDAYSDYELHDLDFRRRLSQIEIDEEKLLGLPLNYCFKDIHKDGKDPMRSRAMHAEEKALALCGREAEGGYLFTTSSPCEMCSKNAKNHRIKKIYYLEAYPGISQAQYTNSGDESNRAELILFSGAVGRAYMQMYTPLLPQKDVLKYLDIKKSKKKH